MPSFFEIGRQAALGGKGISENPYTCGTTKLGNIKLTENGVEWEAGFNSAIPARFADEKEMASARLLDVSRFRRKSNRYYGA